MTRDTSERRTVSFADDRRARIPFAMIGLLLLVGSVGIVATLEQRSDPTIDQDADLVMDQTQTAAQSELRTAVLDATQTAGSSPINSTTASDVDAIDDADTQEEAFRQYVKLLVYVEAVDRLPEAGQSLDDDAQSDVSLEPVTINGSASHIDAGSAVTSDEAIDRVSLEIGQHDHSVEEGVVNAEIEGVEIDATVDGTALPTEERSVSVSVGTPVFELNEQMNEYESELNMGFFDGDGPDPSDPDGLGQEMALRLYPTSYMKASWDRFAENTKSPDDHNFEEVIDTDHTEVLVNHAIFSVQEDTFGTRDPYADRTMRPQYLCMAIDFGSTAGDVDTTIDADDVDELIPAENVTLTQDYENLEKAEDGEVVIVDDAEVDVEEELCGDDGVINEWVFGDEATGELPEVPPLSELLSGGIDSMGAGEVEVEVPADTLGTATYVDFKTTNSTEPSEILESNTDDLESDIGEDRDVGLDPDISDGPERGPEAIIDDLYEVGVTSDTDSHTSGFPSAEPPENETAYTYDATNSTRRVTSVDSVAVSHTPKPDGTGSSYSGEIHEVTVDADVDVERVDSWEARNKTQTSPNFTETTTNGTVDVDADLSVDGEYSVGHLGAHYDFDYPVADHEVLTDFGEDPDAVTFHRAFEDGLVEVTGVDEYDSVESDLKSEVSSALSSSSTGTLGSSAESALVSTSSTTLDSDDVLTDAERSKLIGELDEELEAVHGEFVGNYSDEPYTVQLNELTDDTPPHEARDYIKDEFEQELTYRDAQYATPEEKAKIQQRRAYFDRLHYWLDEFGDDYDDELDEVDDSVDLDILDESLGFVQGFANADFDPEPMDLDGSPVLDDAQYEVSGSPTYLTATTVERDQEPAIRAADETATDFDSDGDVDHDPLAIKTDNRTPWPGVPIVPLVPSKWYATVNTWDVTVKGEYSRFEVSSTVGDPAGSDRLTYVAEDAPVEVELSDGETVDVGQNDAIDFESSTEVVIIMPGAVVQRGGPVPAVADTSDDVPGTGLVFCSDTWKEVGPDADSSGCD